MKNFLLLSILLVALLSKQSLYGQSIWKNISATDNRNSVAFGNGNYVSVGDGGKISSSTDGSHWTPRSSGTTSTLIRVAYLNGVFMAVGQNGTLLTSADGVTWNVRVTGTTQPLYGVAFGNGSYIVVGNQVVLSSANGSSWTAMASPPSEMLLDVAYGLSKFVAVAFSGAVLTSPTGSAWTAQTSGTTNFLYSIVFGNNAFAAVGNAGTIITSSDGSAWSARTSGTSVALTQVTYNGGQFVSAGSSGVLLTSGNGTIWSSQTSGTSQVVYGITYGNSQFVAVGTAGVTLTSGNGTAWTVHQAGYPIPSTSITDLTFNGQFTALSNNGMFYSSDGISWTSAPGFDNQFIGAIINNTAGNLLGVSSAGRVWYSASNSWQSSSLISGQALYDISAGNGRFVIGSNFGALYYSTTGSSWTATAVPGGLLPTLSRVRYLNGSFVALGTYTSSTTLFSSTDGSGWTQKGSVPMALRSISFGNGLFVGVGDNGNIMSSPDLITWESRTSGSSQSLRDICFAYGYFVAVGNNGTVLTSTNGISWTTRESFTTNALNTVEAGNGVFVVGGSAVILQADADSPLPVTLVRFDAARKESRIELSWQTSSEEQTDRFEVQRSEDGRRWLTIATVAADGDFQGGLRRYAAQDSAPLPGNNLYRLKMVDLDETFAYSRIVAAPFDRPGYVVVYPNPVTERLFVDERILQEGSVVQLLDLSGRIVKQIRVDQAVNGMEVKGLYSGVYILRIETRKGESVIRKVVVK